MDANLLEIRDEVFRRNPGELEFHQAVNEVFESLVPLSNKHPEYADAAILQRICEPERQISLRSHSLNCGTDFSRKNLALSATPAMFQTNRLFVGCRSWALVAWDAVRKFSRSLPTFQWGRYSVHVLFSHEFCTRHISQAFAKYNQPQGWPDATRVRICCYRRGILPCWITASFPTSSAPVPHKWYCNCFISYVRSLAPLTGPSDHVKVQG